MREGSREKFVISQEGTNSVSATLNLLYTGAGAFSDPTDSASGLLNSTLLVAESSLSIVCGGADVICAVNGSVYIGVEIGCCTISMMVCLLLLAAQEVIFECI